MGVKGLNKQYQKTVACCNDWLLVCIVSFITFLFNMSSQLIVSKNICFMTSFASSGPPPRLKKRHDNTVSDHLRKKKKDFSETLQEQILLKCINDFSVFHFPGFKEQKSHRWIIFANHFWTSQSECAKNTIQLCGVCKVSLLQQHGCIIMIIVLTVV